MAAKAGKITVIFVIISIFLFSIAQVYAQGLGVDFLTLVKTKIAYFVGTNTATIPTELGNAREQVENDVLANIDQYIAGLSSELKDYTDAQVNDAQNRLNEKIPNINSELNAVRAELMDQAKQQIKSAVEEQYKIEEEKLNEDLQKKIEEKFK